MPHMVFCEMLLLFVFPFFTVRAGNSHQAARSPRVRCLQLLYHTFTTKARVKKSHYRPGDTPQGSRKLRFPDFKTIGTWRW